MDKATKGHLNRPQIDDRFAIYITLAFALEHGGEVGDVGGGEAQRLDLAELAVDRLGGDELAEVREGAVHALRPPALTLVGRRGGQRRR